MNIAVYSGSFDPLHIGHLAIVEALRNMREFDSIYLVVSPQNPLKSSEKSENADARLDSVRAALARHYGLSPRPSESRHPASRHPELVSGSHPQVFVDDIEFTLPRPNYTINTLDALKEREPGNKFSLVMGADSLCDIRRWREWERILTEYGVVVFPRKGYDTSGLELKDKRYRIRFIDAPMIDVSSTQIRELLSCGKDISTLII